MQGRARWAAVAAVVVMAVPGEATAYPPSPSPSVKAAPGAGVPVCTISDPQVTEVSGLVATSTGYVVVNDSNPDRSKVRIFFLDARCRLTRTVSYPTSALDPEDLAVTKDGTLWIADIGDNTTLSGGSGTRRSTIALWSLAPNVTKPVIHRLVYPDGKPRDAETLLIAGDGTPVIVTKDPAGEVYVPAEPLRADNATGVPLRQVGTFRPQATGTSNPLSFIGAGLVTGGAVSPDGTRAVVRTMADAYEFDVTGGDVAAAITTGTPRVSALPDEPQGESVSYTLDGRSFVTASDQPGATAILRYTPKTAAPATSAAPAPPTPKTNQQSLLSTLSLRDLTWIVSGVGAVGVLMVIVGVVGVRRSRAVRRAAMHRPEGSGP